LVIPAAMSCCWCLVKASGFSSGGTVPALKKKTLQECGQEIGVRGRDLFAPVRAALTGQTHGPELPLLFDALGIETVRARLGAASD
jgi:glutamyl/glutaminyl-tRNA synthetase